MGDVISGPWFIKIVSRYTCGNCNDSIVTIDFIMWWLFNMPGVWNIMIRNNYKCSKHFFWKVKFWIQFLANSIICVTILLLVVQLTQNIMLNLLDPVDYCIKLGESWNWECPIQHGTCLVSPWLMLLGDPRQRQGDAIIDEAAGTKWYYI